MLDVITDDHDPAGTAARPRLNNPEIGRAHV